MPGSSRKIKTSRKYREKLKGKDKGCVEKLCDLRLTVISQCNIILPYIEVEEENRIRCGQKKLTLVLDLDHTLLNSARVH